MSRALITLALAASALLAQASFAESPSNTTSLAPAGQGPGAHESSSGVPGHSYTSRAAVKAKTRAAESAGTLEPAGEAPNPLGQNSSTTDPAGGGMGITTSKTSLRSRAYVKAMTKADRAQGSLQPAGEATRPVNRPAIK